MRKLLVITAFLLFAGIAFGQTLQKGNLIGLHVATIDLKPGATMDQYIDFFNEKYKPAWEKASKGMKVFVVKGLRGENVNEFGILYQFTDEAARDKYYNADGSLNELGIKFGEELAPVMAEGEKIGTIDTKYTDWLLL